MRDLGVELTSLRERAGLKRTDIAEMYGLTRHQVYEAEKKTNAKLAADLILKLRSLLGESEGGGYFEFA